VFPAASEETPLVEFMRPTPQRSGISGAK